MQRRSISSKFIGQIEKIMWICFFWMLISTLQFLTGYTTLIDFEIDMSGLNPIDFFIGALISGLIAGLIGGSVLVFFWENWFRTKSYKGALLNIFWTYTFVYLIVSIISDSINYANRFDTSVFDKRVFFEILQETSSIGEFYGYFFWMIVVIFTLIALMVNDKYGPGVFVSFLLGKYFHPRREERIFMFMDLKGSTSIAERLGEDRYFKFLKDTYRDATPGILDAKGEIYQYVGDEIVISWKLEPGIENANALYCFFGIQQILLDKVAYYQENYDGIIPEFKAGLHYGFVTAGEIGIVKRDIVYSGDVLNTTARIQSKCNELGVKILLSQYLLERLGSLHDLYKPSEMGEIQLRGKKDAVMLYTI